MNHVQTLTYGAQTPYPPLNDAKAYRGLLIHTLTSGGAHCNVLVGTDLGHWHCITDLLPCHRHTNTITAVSKSLLAWKSTESFVFGPQSYFSHQFHMARMAMVYKQKIACGKHSPATPASATTEATSWIMKPRWDVCDTNTCP